MESTIRQRQAGYYAALVASDAAGSSEVFVEFMLQAIRDSLAPFVAPVDKREEDKGRSLALFESNPKVSVSQLAEALGCSKRSVERIVAELKGEGLLVRQGGPRSGSWVVLGDERNGN